MATPLPDPKRYITTTDCTTGISTFSDSLPINLPVYNNLGGALSRLAYTTARPPVILTKDTDTKAYETALHDAHPLVTTTGGANVWYIDTPPGSESPLHRTVSLDFVIQVHGELELVLEDGSSRIIKPGDITIQRSTLHRWRNNSKTEWSRMVGVMAMSEPVELEDGTRLSAQFPG